MRKVLIIEDDISMLHVYEKLLNYEGYTVITAENGEMGVAKAKQESPSIILLDVMMPKKSGFQVLEELKNTPETKNIPVILLTNLASEAVISEAYVLGASSYLVKSQTSNDKVLQEVKKYLG